MELRHLRYFVAVAEEQNVTRAAARLHVSQPPLSRQIRDLEDELGVALFEHGAKAVRLTEAGKVFLTEARAVLQRADEAVQMTKAVASGQRGEIHVGYAPSLSVELLPRALRFFQEANPDVRVQLHDMSTQEMLRGLRGDKLHVALLIQVSAKVLTGLVFEELHRYAVCVAVQALLIMEPYWVQQKVEMPKPQFDAQKLGDYISGCMKNGGAVTINLGIYQDGSVDPRAVDVLKEVRERIRKEQP